MAKRKRKTDLITEEMLSEADAIDNVIIHIKDVGTDFSVDPDVYDEDDCKKIFDILDKMTDDIYIDKSYVKHHSNGSREAFINEDKWYDMLEIIKLDMVGYRLPRMMEENVRDGITAIIYVYLMGILDKYGFNPESIDLSIDSEHFSVEYSVDESVEEPITFTVVNNDESKEKNEQ